MADPKSGDRGTPVRIARHMPVLISGNSPTHSHEPPLVSWLRKAESYPERTERVEMLETHISWIFLTDRHAYKLKKPVKFDFLDFSTPQKRAQACRAEVFLNRRLSPDVYLDVVPVTTNVHHSWAIGGESTPQDWLVKMRRLPADRSLDKVIERGALSEEDGRRLSQTLADFFTQLPPLPIRTEAYRQKVEEHVRDNRRELLDARHQLDECQVKRLHAAQLTYLRARPEIFDGRACDGRVVDGHGDLRPEHIYLLPAPAIIDCIEFNSEYRQLDVLDDLSFLAVECTMLGADSLSGQILDTYCRRSGDTPPSELLSFYMSYRAAVRAKVFALRAAQLAGAEQTQVRKVASDYLALADHHAARIGSPHLVLVRGLTGTGKSTVALALAESLGLELLQTDAIRNHLLGASKEQAEFDQGLYSHSNRLKVYEEMFDRAGELLKRGQSVVLDGTFLTEQLRTRAGLLARHFGARPCIVECQCPDEVAEERITARKAETSLSESRSEFVRRQREQEEPLGGAIPSCQVDTTDAIPAILDVVFGLLK